MSGSESLSRCAADDIVDTFHALRGTRKALRALHTVCKRMDLENQDARPTEEEYLAAMASARRAVRAPAFPWKGHRPPRAAAPERCRKTQDLFEEATA